MGATAPHGVLEMWWTRLGDPNIVDWTITISYIITAVLCFVVARSFKRHDIDQRRERRTWFLLGAVMIFMGINKQLDLQLLARLMGRQLAHQWNFYEYHRTIQVIAIVVICVITFIAAALATKTFYRCSGALHAAGVGTILLIGYIMARSLSFTHLDDLLGYWVLNIRLYWFAELAAIASIMIPAAIACAGRNKNGSHATPEKGDACEPS